MTPEQLQGIKCSVDDFYSAISQIKSNDFHFGVFSFFPKNCCEFASILLSKYLEEIHGYRNLELVLGENKFNSNIRHVWIKYGRVDIDITPGQFPRSAKTVIVEINSLWHVKEFRITNRSKPDISFETFHDDVKDDLLSDYRMICRTLQ